MVSPSSRRMKTPLALLVAAALLLAGLPDLGQAKKIPKWWMRVAQRQGPNACVVEEVPGTGMEFWTECRYWLNRKICGRKTIARFECCEGFEQIEGENGCTRVKPLMNLLETAEALGATRWAAYIRESGLANELETAGAYTLFAPTNEAFDGARASVKSQLDSYRGNPNNPILLYHIIPTKLPSDHFEANTVVETRHAGNFLRINKYSNGMNTINCALLLQKDQQATNGIVHIIDSMLDPSKSLPENVADMVIKDGRFTVLSEMLEKSGYINVLRTMQGSITFLAPSDEAFQKLPDSRREKIINDREARLALIQNHIIPHVICESAITGEHRVRTVSSNKLTFNCDIEGAYVETSKLRNNFNLGKNGIIHILDDVLLPDRAKNLIELAESRQLFTFAELVRNAGLEETLSHTGDYTFFVPDENAWFELEPSVLQQARSDVEYAGLLLRFHGAYGRHLTNAITDNQAIMSLDEENPVRLQVWRRAMGVEDARITTPDVEAQNGVIHIINKVIFPSNQSATATLRSLRGEESFETYLDLLQRASSQTPPVLSLRPGDDTFYTFFVPSDSAFDRMDASSAAQLRSRDSNFVTSFVKKHIAVNMFPYTSFEPNLIYSIEGMDGTNFNLKKDGGGKLTANGIPVTSSHMSANGVIHVISDVFTPPTGGYGGGSTSYSSSSSSRSSSHGGARAGGGGSGTSYYSSSSSSAGGVSTTRTTRTYKTITFAEGFEDADGRLPAIPQGSELASSTRGRPEIVPSPSSPLPARTQPSSTERRGTSTSQNAANFHASSSGTAPLDIGRTSPARVHDNTDRYSSNSVHSETNPNPSYGLHGYRNPSSNDALDYEPGLDQWERSKLDRDEFGSTRRPDYSSEGTVETYNETDEDSEYEEELRVEEERRRRLEIARQEEIERQEEMKRQEEQRRQEELKREEALKKRNELKRDEELRKRNELRREEESRRIEQLRREEQERQEELTRQEDLRRRSELDRENEIRNKQEEQRLLEEDVRRRKIVSRRQEELRRQQEENAAIEERNRLRELESRRRQGEIKNQQVGGRDLAEVDHSGASRSEYHWSSSHSYGGDEDRHDSGTGPLEPGLLTRSFDTINTLDEPEDSNPARGDNSISQTSKVTTHVSTHKTIGPISPNGTRYSYVGRSYGDDIVGHDSYANPYINPGGSGSLIQSSSQLERPVVSSNGVTRMTTRRRVNVTRTVYSYPVPQEGDQDIPNSFNQGRDDRARNRQSPNFNRQQQFAHPARVPDNKASSDFVSAYAFTGAETEYADGDEFVEAGTPVEATIKVQRAQAALRRQRRRKRHHMLKNKALADEASAHKGSKEGHKLARRGRGGKAIRKGLRKRQAMRRQRKLRTSE